MSKKPMPEKRICSTSHERKSTDRMKYFAKKIRNEFGEFDSKTEYERFLYLKHLEDIGVISHLKQQVRFEIIPKLVKKVKVQLKTKTKEKEVVEEQAKHYTADFTYINSEGQLVISEVKSKATATARDYPLRRALIKQIIYKHNLEVDFEDWVFEEFIPTVTRKKKCDKYTSKDRRQRTTRV